MQHIATQEFDNEYLRVLRDVLVYGKDCTDVRTEVGRRRLFSQHMKFDISAEFPLLTTKKVNYKAVFNELVWMVAMGSTDVNWLNEQGHTFWDEWKLEDGTIGKGYGKQFRDCKGVDQVANVIKSIKETPHSTRHVISLWQPDEIPEMSLPPCHGVFIEFFVEEGMLSCHMTQRSGDMFLGVPFNIAFYSMLTRVIAQLTGLLADEFSHLVVDAHIYLNHIDQVKEQLTRKPKAYPFVLISPTLRKIDDFVLDDVTVIGYNSHSHIKAPVSI